MQLISLFFPTFLGLLSVTLAGSHPRDFSLPAPSIFAARDECRAHGSICAEVMIGNKVNQQLDFDGCMKILDPDEVTGIKTFDCDCNLYYAVDSGSCNSGVDETIDRLPRCSRHLTRKERRWKKSPNYWSCSNH